MAHYWCDLICMYITVSLTTDVRSIRVFWYVTNVYQILSVTILVIVFLLHAYALLNM